MAPALSTDRRPFRAGTTGWTVRDLDDPRIEALWERGRYEIVEGVLTRTPPAYFDPSLALKRLVRLVDAAIKATDPDGEVLGETRCGSQ